MDATQTPDRRDPVARIREALGHNGDRTHAAMEAVRHKYVRTRRDTLLRDHFERLLHDLVERRKPVLVPDQDHRDQVDDQERATEQDHDPGKGRREANMLLVLGESGAGKTRIIDRLLSTHPATIGYGNPSSDCPVISVTAPSPCGVKELGRVVLARTGYEIARRNVSGPEIWGIVHKRLKALGILVLHIDEAQHATQLRDVSERQKLRNTIKSLMVDPDHPVAVILSGLPEITRFITPDVQLSRRTTAFQLPSVELPADLKMLTAAVTKFAGIANLGVEVGYEMSLLPRLVHAGDHRLGVIIEEIHGAIRYALGAKSTILDRTHFAKAFADRTGNAPEWNPYRRSDYRKVDVWRMIVVRDEEEASDERTKPSIKGKDR